MQRLSLNRSILLRYSLALLIVAVAMVVRYDLSPIVGGLAALFGTVGAAVIFTAWLAGTGPAPFAATASLAAANWSFLAPTHALRSEINMAHEATSLVVFVSALLLSAAYRVELRRREARDREVLHDRDALREAEEK